MWIINNQANFDILKHRKEIHKTFQSQKNNSTIYISVSLLDIYCVAPKCKFKSKKPFARALRQLLPEVTQISENNLVP